MLRLSNLKLRMDLKSLTAKCLASLLLGVTVGVILLRIGGLPLLTQTPQSPTLSYQPILSRFSSYEELLQFLNRTIPAAEGIRTLGGSTSEGSVKPTGGEGYSGVEGSQVEYSRTNVQVEGVDEADIVKCDGERIYLVSKDGVLIVKAYPPEDAKVLTSIKLNGTVKGIYINNLRLVIFEESSPIRPIRFLLGGAGLTKTYIKIYDLGVIDDPVLVREVAVNGSYFDSRMIGDYVYVVVVQPALIYGDKVLLPYISYNGVTRRIEPSEIYHPNSTDYRYLFTTILAINIQNELEEPTYQVFLLGATGTLYVSLDNIYLTIPRYPVVYMILENKEAQRWTNVTNLEKTEIYRLHIEGGNITCEASGVVPGYILNQFSMDEYKGYLRVATTIRRFASGFSPKNNVYILNERLVIVGRLEGIAPGETIYSARFIGDRCYLVTFRRVDPFFVIDLSEPTEPKVLGWLKVSGFSRYLHPYDENHIIGIGMETEVIDDTVRITGMKISLFDVSDVENPIEVGRYVIRGRVYSPILWDHKALLFDKERNLLVIPISTFEKRIVNNTVRTELWQGVYVFNITAEGLTLRGNITHVENLTEWGSLYQSYIKRSLYIDNILYTVSDVKVKMNSLLDLSEIGEVELPGS